MKHQKAANLATLIENLPKGQLTSFSESLSSSILHLNKCLVKITDKAENAMVQEDLSNLVLLREFINSVNSELLI